jgi:hypothetical protein
VLVFYNGARARKMPTSEQESVPETRELEELEMRIAEAETRKAGLEKRMRAHPSDYGLIQELNAELQPLNAKLERDMER